ncbi:hypothetical protein LV84_02741 [Algoriphagus ratkowskyi]|uniref:Uncharacterized protein n=1 Tax=Algoriphagus ratkowskyi TaxID=57028 RepID=A0A2W7R1D5_9BACT|nr:hypothetical protein LV84_02741 [Algoriphagus ratkowskyi]
MPLTIIENFYELLPIASKNIYPLMHREYDEVNSSVILDLVINNHN